MKKIEALKAWADGHLLDEFTIIPFHEYILKLNKV